MCGLKVNQLPNALAQIVDSAMNIHLKAGKLDEPVLLLEPVQSYKLQTANAVIILH